MALRTSPGQRQRFYAWHSLGQTYAEIAAHERVSVECVRYWCRALQQGRSAHSHWPHRPPGRLGHFGPRIHYAVLRLRLEHPHWGPARIRFHLQHRPSLCGQALPSAASIGRYLHQWPRFRRRVAPPARRERPQPPQTVHQRWQVDFKLGIRLRNGSCVNLHTVRDPVGEACLGAFVFPATRSAWGREHVTGPQVRTVLRRCFSRWGTLPAEVQTDGESALTGKAGEPFPSVFTLWLTGLGILHRVTRPSTPTDNAEVERCHRTVCDYGIVGQEQGSWQDLQVRLDQAVQDLAFELGSRAEGCHGRSPVQAHPELLTPPRPFDPAEEVAQFELPRVDAYLATFTWKRKVDLNGQLTLAGRHAKYSVGRRYAYQEVWVKFDPQDRHYVFYRSENLSEELGRRPARGLSVPELTGLADGPSGPGPQQLPLPLPRG